MTLKHLLGLTTASGGERFALLYLWHDVAGHAGTDHANEIERFADVARADGIHFTALTYQDLILRLARAQRNEHPAYVDYIAERYL